MDYPKVMLEVEIIAKETKYGQPYPAFQVVDTKDGCKVPLFGGSLAIKGDPNTGEIVEILFQRIYAIGNLSDHMNLPVTDGIAAAVKASPIFASKRKKELPGFIEKIPAGPVRDAAIAAYLNAEK